MFKFPALGPLTENALLLCVTLLLVTLGNITFFSKVFTDYALTPHNAVALISLPLLLGIATLLPLALLCLRRTIKPVLICLLLLSSLTAGLMDSYGVVINTEMLDNALQTDFSEARDLLTVKLLVYVIGLGVLPSILVARTELHWRGWRVELLARLKLLLLAVALAVAVVLTCGSFYASFVREHKPLRSYANPTYPLYSFGKFVRSALASPADTTVRVIGMDARIASNDPHRELVILVVGETARGDHFSLNGYARETNPQLSRSDVISFTDFQACGTSTAVSVPCMFSLAGSSAAAQDKRSEGLLDVLQRAGVNVLWLDNNSDSKGVAERVPYRNFKSPENNPVCDTECRDEGMPAPLQGYIDSHPRGDIFIVLHQMGNHGPAYYKRYPAAFEHFKPTCQSNDLSTCSREEVVNAYDNALRYTDHFLARTIDLLKHNSDAFEAALFYVSDHGESLGEKGAWLHGLPKAIAPDAQLHVPAIMWFSDSYDELNLPALQKKRNQPFTHDHLFHTMLGFMEIETSIYHPALDILDGCRKPDGH